MEGNTKVSMLETYGYATSYFSTARWIHTRNIYKASNGEDIIRRAKLEAMLQPSPPGDDTILDTPSYSTSLGQSITRTCIGTGCALTKHYKQFRVYSNATNANDKKCPQCKTFEAALNKVLQIVDYLVEQLGNPTDDIFRLLQGLSLLMTESKHNVIKNHRYYNEVLTIPKIKEV